MGAAEDRSEDVADADELRDLTAAERAKLRALLRALLDLIEPGARAGLEPRKRPPPKKYPTGTPEQEMRIRASVMKRLQGKE